MNTTSRLALLLLFPWSLSAQEPLPRQIRSAGSPVWLFTYDALRRPDEKKVDFALFRTTATSNPESLFAPLIDDPEFSAAVQRRTDSLRRNPPSYDSVVISLVLSERRSRELPDYEYDLWIDGQKIHGWELVNAGADTGWDRRAPDDSTEVRHMQALDRVAINGQRVDMHFRRLDGTPVGTLHYQEYPQPRLILPFFSKQKDQVTAFREGGSSDLPFIRWERYGLQGPAATQYYRGQAFKAPSALDITASAQPVMLWLEEPMPGLSYTCSLYQETDTGDRLIRQIVNRPGDPVLVLPRLDPGNYFVRVAYAEGVAEPLTYYISLRPGDYRSVFILSLAVAGLLLLCTLLLLWINKRRFRRKERRLFAQKEQASLQNEVFRSQLNPHFIFNALSSIQALINKGDTARANEYLSDFAQMLRQTLDRHKAEYWTLDDELQLLQQYVKLEQLRFPFFFDLKIGEGIEPVNHEFPAMLLQPLLENAIRHGLFPDRPGKIGIEVKRQQLNLTIVVKDNGTEINTFHLKEGVGLRLTKERIAFLNRQESGRYGFELQSDAAGTSAILTCKEYFAAS